MTVVIIVFEKYKRFAAAVYVHFPVFMRVILCAIPLQVLFIWYNTFERLR